MADVNIKLEDLNGSIEIKVEPPSFPENGSQEIKSEEMELHDSIDIKEETWDYDCQPEEDFETETSKQFECGVCKLTFPDDLQLAEHETIHNLPEPFLGSSVDRSKFYVIASSLYNYIYACKMCDYKTYEVESLPLHLETHSEVKQISDSKDFECESCSCKCYREEILKAHLMCHPREKPFKCDFCDFKCARKENLKIHLRLHSSTKLFECAICDYKTKTKTMWRLHQRTHCIKICKVCRATFSKELHFEEHKKIHTLPQQFSCEVIDHSKFFIKASRWCRDLVILVCKICHFKTYKIRCFWYPLQTNGDVKCPQKLVNGSLETPTKPKDLNRIIDIKEEDSDNEYHSYQDYGRKIRKKIKCDVCNATFDNDLQLEEHKVLHTKSEQVNFKSKFSLLASSAYSCIYSCNACSYTTQELESINDHLKSHFKKMLFSCDYCDFETIQSKTLKGHLLTHGKKKPFECKMCGYKFLTRKDIVVHSRTHPEKQFQCEYCLYKTNRETYLHLHLRKHSGKNLTFKCNVCDFKSSKKETLKTHLASHIGAKAYEYKICSHNSD